MAYAVLLQVQLLRNFLGLVLRFFMWWNSGAFLLRKVTVMSLTVRAPRLDLLHNVHGVGCPTCESVVGDQPPRDIIGVDL